jgi:hypothetical protein
MNGQRRAVLHINGFAHRPISAVGGDIRTVSAPVTFSVPPVPESPKNMYPLSVYLRAALHGNGVVVHTVADSAVDAQRRGAGKVRLTQ